MDSMDAFRKLIIKDINTNKLSSKDIGILIFFANNLTNKKLILTAQKALCSLFNENISPLIKLYYFHEESIDAGEAQKLYLSKAIRSARKNGVSEPLNVLEPYFIGIIPVAVDTLLKDKAAYKKLQGIKAEIEENL